MTRLCPTGGPTRNLSLQPRAPPLTPARVWPTGGVGGWGVEASEEVRSPDLHRGRLSGFPLPPNGVGVEVAAVLSQAPPGPGPFQNARQELGRRIGLGRPSPPPRGLGVGVCRVRGRAWTQPPPPPATPRHFHPPPPPPGLVGRAGARRGRSRAGGVEVGWAPAESTGWGSGRGRGRWARSGAPPPASVDRVEDDIGPPARRREAGRGGSLDPERRRSLTPPA